MPRSTSSPAKTPPKLPSKLTITKTFVDDLGPTGERQVYRDDKARGLLLRVNADGSKAWYFDYRDPDGKRQSFKIGDADRIDPGDARKRLKTLGEDPAGERRLQKAEQVAAVVEVERSAQRTLRAFLEGDYWAKHLKHARSGLATKKRIFAAWAPLLDTDMASLDVQAAVDHRQKRRDAGANPRTLNRDRIALMAAVNKAAEWDVLTENPLAKAAFKPLGSTVEVAGDADHDDSDTDDGKRVRWLGKRDDTEDVRDDNGKKVGERERFLAALIDTQTPAYLRDICTVAMHTGLRRGELFKLQWTRVSISNASLTVSAATAKSGKPRDIALNVVALEVFKRVWAEREEAARVAKEAGKPVKISPYVFVNSDTGLPFTTLKKSWAALVSRGRLTDFTFHDLRHDFASRLVQAGVNLYEVKDLLGHSSITLTERYSHLAPHAQRAAVARLESA